MAMTGKENEHDTSEILSRFERDMTMSRYEREDWDHFRRKNSSHSFPFHPSYWQQWQRLDRELSLSDLSSAGYKTALFSKPYFYKVNEMMQINGEMINDKDFARIFSEKEKEIKAAISRLLRSKPILLSPISMSRNPILPSSNAAWAAHR
jgi:DNA repair photolyase